MFDNYFIVVRVFPDSNSIYDWASSVREVHSMSSYDSWLNLRKLGKLDKGSILYVKKNIVNRESLVSIVNSLSTDISKKLHEGLEKAQHKYDESEKTSDDWDEKEKEFSKVRAEINKNFTDLIRDTDFELIEFN